MYLKLFDKKNLIYCLFLRLSFNFCKFDLTVGVIKNILYDKKYFLVFKPSMNSGQ